jgi:cobalt-zinc-cadmium efflux system membrane fusion protein
MTVVAFLGFSYIRSNQTAATTEEESRETDADNIILTPKQVKAAELRMGTWQQRPIATTIKANGQLVLRAQSKGEVAALMGGIVKQILVKEGQQVRKHQVVAWIENTEIVSLQREYYGAYRERELAQQELVRQEQLTAKGAGIGKNLQATQKEYRVAQANLTGLAQQLQQLGISPRAVAQGRFTSVFPVRATIAGTVSELTASVGSYADMQTPLMRLRDNGEVECDLNVFERDLDQVRVGSTVTLSLINQPGRRITGRVYGHNPYFSNGSKSVAVHVRLDRPASATLFEGMPVTGEISSRQRAGAALPSAAIVSQEGKSYVFALDRIARDGSYHFSRHEVTPGASHDGYTEVSPCAHITATRQVVVDQAYYLASMTGNHEEEE